MIAAALADDRHGATDIERRLIRRLLEARTGWSRPEVAGAAAELRERSPMANLRHLAGMIEQADDLSEIERRLERRLDQLDGLGERLADVGFDWVSPKALMCTISRSSAVEAVLTGAWRRGWRGRTVVFDGTASGGGTEQAERLGEFGLTVRSLPDGAMLEELDRGAKTAAVLIGADAVGPERLINARGTALLVESAARRGIPRLVVADSGKNVAEDDIDQLLEAGRTHQETGPGRHWPVFEAVSLRWVEQRLSETGIGVIDGG